VLTASPFKTPDSICDLARVETHKKHLRGIANGRHHGGVHIAIRHMEDVCAGDLVEIFASQMGHGTDPGRRAVELTGMLLGVGHKLSHGFCRHAGVGETEAATAALARLESDDRLSSYRLHIRHGLANQRARRREAEYDRPDWPRTLRALNNGPPANVPDLHALLVAHLEDVKQRIASANTDIYKWFWNEDRYGRIATPKPEESCRDVLVGLIRPALLPLGITVEPEGHMVADNRADISVAMPSRKILCELKRVITQKSGARRRSSSIGFTQSIPKRRDLGCTACSGSERRGHFPSRRRPMVCRSRNQRWKSNRDCVTWCREKSKAILQSWSSTCRGYDERGISGSPQRFYTVSAHFRGVLSAQPTSIPARETGACPCGGWGRHFPRVGETVARSSDTQRTRCSDPSHTLFIKCNGLRTRSLKPRRVGVSNRPTVTPLSRARLLHHVQTRRIRHHPPANSDSCSKG
jgi:hypothetical protein